VPYRLAGCILRRSVQHTLSLQRGGTSKRAIHHFDINDLCSLVEVDLIDLAVVAATKVIPHSLIGLKDLCPSQPRNGSNGRGNTNDSLCFLRMCSITSSRL
jgi:hypothetical protein